ncbi:hypothetical protein MNBD_GAMMA12-1912 [hydrothermal vent metagenome]|uniref:Uncharacterized protein n=1 Tax=hydrothermal vent metagenome TaxID=652676 RepID=A0A3B0YU17_9ZZZZ
MQVILSVTSVSALVTMLMVSFGKNVDVKIQKCRTSSCLYERIIKNKESQFTFDSCKSFDGKLSRRPNRDDMGKLCRLYVARKLAGMRKENRCLNIRSLKHDFDESVTEHSLWVYSKLLYQNLPKELRMLDKLPRSDFKNKSVNNAYVLSRFGQFNEKYKVKKVIKRKRRKDRTRLVKKTNVRKVAFDVYYCMVNKKDPRYIPYFYSVRMTPSVIGEKKNTEKEMSSKVRYTLKYVKHEYLKELPFKNEKVIGQLSNAKLKRRYLDYQLMDFNGDGHKDVVFLDDVFKKYRPGVCLYQPGKDACRVVLPKRFSQSGILLRDPHLTADPKKGIQVIIVDKQYKSNRETFKYIFGKKGSLRRL